METLESLRFVIDTISKVDIMVKILKDVASDLYRTQLIAHIDKETVGCRTDIKDHSHTTEDDLLRKISNLNMISGDMALGTITNVINLYLDNTIITRDSFISIDTKQDRSHKQNSSNEPNNKGS